MRKYLIFILLSIVLFAISPIEVYAATDNRLSTDLSETVSLLTPPNGLTPAKGDGTDETKVIQAIFDYATAGKKTILIPKNYAFNVNNLSIINADHFSILGYGTLKHKDGATKALLNIQKCSNFNIKVLTTDGNVEGNKTKGNRINEFLHSVQIFDSNDFHIDTIIDKNPAGDSLYMNNVTNVTIGNISAIADYASGRNALSIVKAQNVTVDKVLSQNVGFPTMPGGIDLEPNNATDNIQNVLVKSAIIRTSGTCGLAVANYKLATVKDIEINAVVTRFDNPIAYEFKLVNVDHFKGKIKCYQEGTKLCYGAIIASCNYVDINLEIYNSTRGLYLGEKSTHINLTGKIIGSTQNGIGISGGVSYGVIDMEIKKVSSDSSQGVYTGSVVVGAKGANNLIFSGDYSFETSGVNCFRVDGVLTNCKTENLNMSGWAAKNKVTGANAATLLQS